MAKTNPVHALQTIVLGIVILLVLIALPRYVFAADLNVSWTHPAQNTDGTAIPASGAGALTETRIEYGLCNGTSWGTKTGESIVAYPATTVVIPGVGPGTWCVRGYSRNSFGVESVASNIATKVVPPPTPRPPTLVTVESVAYEIKLRPVTQMASLGRRVGVIAYGVPCQEGALVETIRGEYYPVPQDKVMLYHEPKSSIVVARCAAI